MRLAARTLYLITVQPQPLKINAIVSNLLAWYPHHARDLPWRREPYRNDPYAVYVSEIMLQQTQVNTVRLYWERWMRALPDLQSLAAARPETIHKLWEGLGYYTRVRNMQRAAQVIQNGHGGVFPRNYEAVLELPGIGPYTAGAICSIAFNQPTPILDGNVIRVLTRLFGIGGDPREKATNRTLWELAGLLVQRVAPGRNAAQRPAKGLPARACAQLNQALMELGALVCTPKQPRCVDCPVAGLCLAQRQDQVDRFPALSRRAPVTARRFVAFVVQQAGRFLVRQRPAGVVNAHLWEFPNLELDGNGRDVGWAAAELLGVRNVALEPFLTLKHSITRYRIELEVYRVPERAEPALQLTHGRWASMRQLLALPLCGAHGKIRARLRQEGRQKSAV